MLRFALLLSCTSACAGGQTGEITTLSMCEVVTARVPIGELNAAEREGLARASADRTAALAWTDTTAATSLSLTLEHTDAMASRVGPGGCAKAVRVPAAVHIATADGRLAADVEAVIELNGLTAVVQGAAVSGLYDGAEPMDLTFWREDSETSSRGEISVNGTPVASF